MIKYDKNNKVIDDALTTTEASALRAMRQRVILDVYMKLGLKSDLIRKRFVVLQARFNRRTQ